YSNETKQPITDKLSAIGCLKGVLIPVSKTGVSPKQERRYLPLSQYCLYLCRLSSLSPYFI
ncbi:hypothetical protein P9160_00090, partial [Bacillus halotolerans]|uniref:hypothetical protein n=1 Tax=Bacillus halotolerans TaxID=260554 RepID=UPI002DBA7FE3